MNTKESHPKYIAKLLLTHGAGAPVESDFIQQLSLCLDELDIRVIPFNFAYMQKQVELGKKHPPSRANKLVDEFIAYIEDEQFEKEQQPLPLFIGGKSMGGRMATLVATQSLHGEITDTSQLVAKIKGTVVFGYPFHPPGKLEKTRIDHLTDTSAPIKILQGERDTFGKVSEVQAYPLSNTVDVSFITDGDHSFKPRKASGISQIENIQQAAQYTLAFIRRQLSQS